MDDTIEVSGLSEVLDEENDPPYLDLRLRSGGRSFRAAVLAAEGQWTVNLRDERGKSCAGSGELYDTQADAILAALYMTVGLTRQRIL